LYIKNGTRVGRIKLKMNSTNSAALSGIYVPHIVPYKPNGKINENELRRIVHWLGAKGVSGFYPNGSMGEFIRLSYEERRDVVRIVVEEAGGKPVLAGAAEPNIDLVLEMCTFCANLGCRAVSITGPYYYKLTQESIETYFREIAAKSPIDIIVYNIPAFSNEISVPVLKRLALDCPRIIGTKDTSRDMSRFQQVMHAIKSQRPEFSVLIGWEELLCSSLFMGGDGGTVSSAGVVPEVIMKIFNAASAGDWTAAKSTQYKLLDLFSLMLGAPSFLEGFRLGYELRGFEVGNARFPSAPDELKALEVLRGRIACMLNECGFSEAAAACEGYKTTGLGGNRLDAIANLDLESIVREVLISVKSKR
jgi:dihydrodipicolinate synthase/N-acetylneuraminate lyase